MIPIPKPQRFLLLLILLACGLGAWVSGELLKAHDGLWEQRQTTGGLIGRLCESGSKVGLNCAGAAHGQWSEFTLPVPRHPLRVPTAFLGLAYFVTLGTWFVVVGGAPGVHRRWRLIPAAVTLGGLVGSVFMAGLMVARRAEPCAACIAVHGINILGVVAIWRFFARTSAQEAQDALAAGYGTAPAAGSGRRLVFVAMLAAAAGTLGLWMYRTEHLALRDQWRKLLPYKTVVSELRDDRAFLRREHLAQEVHEFAARPGETLEAGRPRLVAFIDYECPNCGAGSLELIEHAKKTFGERLEVVIRHYPLCSECNGAVKEKFHPHACAAAWAAEAARMQGGVAAFARMHNLLMTYVGQLNPEALRGLAAKAGLDGERFAQDFKGEEVRRAVAADVELAHKWGVTGTPAFFLDGRRIDRRFEGPAMWEALAGQDEGGRSATQPATTRPAATQPAATMVLEGGRDARPSTVPGGQDVRLPVEGRQ